MIRLRFVTCDDEISALIRLQAGTAALRACGFFQWPLTVPFHHISPRDLFLMLSSHVEIDH